MYGPYEQLFSIMLDLEHLPLIQRESIRDYMDDMTPEEMGEYPVVRVRDKLGRNGLAFHLQYQTTHTYEDHMGLEQTFQKGSDSRILVLFQRYTNDDDHWVIAWNQSQYDMMSHINSTDKRMPLHNTGINHLWLAEVLGYRNPHIALKGILLTTDAEPRQR